MEKRKQARHRANFQVYLSYGNTSKILLKVANYSEDGLYILSNGNQMPALGSVVQVKLKQPIPKKNSPPLLDMVIKRVDQIGIGLQYLQAA